MAKLISLFACHCNPDFAARLVGFSCQLPLPTRLLLAWLVLFQSFVNVKRQNLLYNCHWKTDFVIRLVGEALPHQPNQTKTIFLVRLRYSNRRLTRKLFHIRQTKLSGYSTSGRIKPSCYSSLLFRRLFHIALNINVATQRMGNGNKVLHTEPSKSQYSISPLVLVILEITNTNGCWYHPRYSGHYHVTSGHHHFISGHYHVTSGHHHLTSGHPNLHQRSLQTTLAHRHSCTNGRCRYSSKHN